MTGMIVSQSVESAHLHLQERPLCSGCFRNGLLFKKKNVGILLMSPVGIASKNSKEHYIKKRSDRPYVGSKFSDLLVYI